MPKVSIIRPDNTVYVDQIAMTVDCSHLPEYFHAIQWRGDLDQPFGEIEYAEDRQGRKLPNTRFADFTPYQYLVEGWETEKQRVAAAERERLAAEEAAGIVRL